MTSKKIEPEMPETPEEPPEEAPAEKEEAPAPAPPPPSASGHVVEPWKPITVPNLGEAGGIAWTTIIKRQKVGEKNAKIEINLTGRGATAAEALENLFNGLALALEHGYSAWKAEEPTRALPKATGSPQTGNSTPKDTKSPSEPETGLKSLPGAKKSAPAATPPSAAPTSPSEEAGGVIHASKMSVGPRQDGKVDIKFFAASHKWADIVVVRDAEEAIAVLSVIAPFSAADLQVAAEYPVDVFVRFVYSEKKNSKGNPYKDLVDIQQAAG